MNCNRIIIPVVLIAMFYLAGCSGSAGPLDGWPNDPQAMSQRYRSTVGGQSDGGQGAIDQSEDAALPDQADAQTYVDLAMKNNPSIRAAQLRVLRLNEKVAQAGALDDPMFMVGAGDMAQTAAGQSQFSTGISQ